ncbi:nucleotidyltransferase domain-containing protein [Belnapia rosea]|uniref:nucleotidyltransferase domain-containing protein n=1 Tax=Belnapia rosea TaxID=938405 RepID=UPI00087FE46F|nr:nucleotidyltransferase domain-containing protein [Belnapia rosea]SDB22496.1 Nucleotidyltransferase domain-containing protein [Belnapia rosea]
MTRVMSCPLASVGPTDLDAIRRFRRAIQDAFPGRLWSLVLLGSRPWDDHEAGRELEVAVFIDGFDRDREGNRLGLLAVPFRHEGFAMSPIGLPADRRGVSPEMLVNIDRQGTRLPSVRCPGELLAEEPRLADFMALARERLSAREVWVFGSRARGDHRPDSDWDLLLILPDDLPEDGDEAVRLWRLSREVGLAADIVAVRETDAREARAVQSTLMYEVGLEGVRIDLACLPSADAAKGDIRA